MAGLAAAERLHASGMTCRVLEGRDRIGGRVHTDRSRPEAPVDLGASWIQGIRNNPLVELAASYGAQTAPSDDDSAVLFDDAGRRLSDAEVSTLEKRFKRVMRWLEARREDEEGKADYPLRAALNAYIEEEQVSGEDLRQLEYAANTTIEHEYAADVGQLSFHHWDDDNGLGGGDVFFPQGYDALASGLAKGLDVRLGQVVEHIRVTDGGVTIRTSRSVFEADRAIVTLPLGVLKSGSVVFEPPLPEDKQQSIDRLGVGLLDKLVLRFEKPFWGDAEIIGYIAKERGRWAEGRNFYATTKSADLMLFNAGSYAETVARWPDERIVADAMDVLKAMYGPATLHPVAHLVSRWRLDPMALGSYSYLPPGATSADRVTLSKPVGDRLHFAGEATHQGFSALVTGAYLSGKREAERILTAASSR